MGWVSEKFTIDSNAVSVIILTILISLFSAHFVSAYGPSVYFNWSYPSTQDQVVVTLTDTGTDNDINMHVWAGWDAGNGRVWSQNQYGPFTLNPGENYKVTLPLSKPPGGEWTRMWVKVWGDNIYTIISYGNYFQRTCTGPHMSFTKPVYMTYACVAIDDGQYGCFKSSYSFRVSPGTHNWVMVGTYYNGDTYTWQGSGTTYDCRPYSFIAG